METKLGRTKLVPVTFTDAKDMYRQLLDGKVFIDEDGGKAEYIGATNVPFKYTDEEERVLLQKWMIEQRTWFEEVQAEWYEDIPEQGVLCWVWDAYDEDKIRAVVTSYEPRREVLHYKVDGDNYWGNATPLTKEEALELLL